MKLSDIRLAYEEISGKLSNVNRQLTFAGIAVIWIFRITNNGKTIIPEGLIYPTLLFVVSFLLDILQSLSQSLFWYGYYLYKRRQDSNEDRVINEPEWPSFFFWALLVLKVLALIAAYFALGLYLWKELCPTR